MLKGIGCNRRIYKGIRGTRGMYKGIHGDRRIQNYPTLQKVIPVYIESCQSEYNHPSL